MTPVDLLQSLADFLAEANKNFVCSDADVKKNTLLCIPGYLPLRQNTKSEEYFPHIVPRLSRLEDQVEQGVTLAYVRILFGTYCKDPKTGWLELQNLMENSRQALLKQRLIGKRYSLTGSLFYSASDPPPYPAWLGYMDVTFDIPHPRKEYNV